ncbi:unnamed protein product [Leptosia nina]|uniref:WW domain-containing protein n=1 Tax=Leptosia nina TaxID=320188 RepID=A0AAV1IVX6_9NEOP
MSSKSEEEKLPDGWVLCTSKSNPGRKYYFNKKTGKSSWTQPQETDKNKKPGFKDKQKVNEKKKSNNESRGNKRKSDSNEEVASHKKQRQEPSGKIEENIQKDESQKQVVPCVATPKTPSKLSNTRNQPSTSQPSKRGKKKGGKNLANTRLSQLRSRLSYEAECEDNVHKSPPKKRACNETPKKFEKSPNDKINHSPSHDSLHSIPSPSQFFAANKILSSMKAQLPEQYCNKDKQIDTFADIEKGICNQTPEYPFSKHPATPPQFLEATKLVSAIKSKLGYKINLPSESKSFSSAKDRMESLRNSLGSEVGSNTSNDKESFFNSSELNSSAVSEAMEVEDFREFKHSTPIKPQRRNSSENNVVLVIDTNIFIHELDIIRNVLNSHLKGYSEQPTLLVPWRVINELDRLKDNNNGNGAVCKRAKAAMDYLYKSLPENSRIKGQSLRDANCHIYPCEMPDDEILNCALQQVERGKNVLLVTNDKNLCNKARINSVKNIGINALKGMLENKPQPASAELHATFLHLREIIYPLLANILESEMRAKYENLWQYVIFKAPPWTLEDVLQCLLKHWIAVFNEVFPRIEPLITDLKNALVSLQNKNPKTVTQSEVTTFKELCLDVAKKCQIIPEYMELAKACVERLSRDCASGTEDRPDAIVDAFECIWTVCSSYCAKLATSAGVAHSIEDKIPGEESLPVLTSKWSVFATNINAIARDIQRVLAVQENGATNINEDALSDLEKSFKEVLSSIAADKTVTRNELRAFCTKCRNMLQEASSKFSQLGDLLIICKNKLSN